MSPSRIDQGRIATIPTALSGARFYVRQMDGEEELGRPFYFNLELWTETVDLNFDDFLGKHLTLELETAGQSSRFFDGLVSEVSWAGRSNRYSRCHVQLRPWLWFLTRTSDNRIFQHQSAPDIIKQVFRDNGFSDFKDSLTGSYRIREYCVQYGETSFDFVSRLMEDEGIYYFFKHENGKHVLVLADSVSAHTPIAGESTLSFRMPGEAVVDEEHIDAWAWSHRVQSQAVALTSYNFEKPKTDLAVVQNANEAHAQSGNQLYEYGELYEESRQGSVKARIRVEEEKTEYVTATGQGNVRTLACVGTFKLVEHTVQSQNIEYLIVKAAYEIRNNELEQFFDAGDAGFRVQFKVIAKGASFRAARTTPKALVRGPQTGIVVGTAGEEIWTDKHGRVKVQFHWDREGRKDENSSCWVRVAQVWAGNSWGVFALPRIGQEVIVDFLEGDPDQPIVTGSVYNEDNKPPFNLPEHKTQSGIRTRTTQGGDKNTFNELRFEDKKNEEKIYVHAERDFERVVENNDKLKVGYDKKDEGNQTIEIYNDRSVELAEGNDSLKVVKGNRSVDVKKTITIKAGDELVIEVGQAKLTMKKSGEITLQGVNVTIKGQSKVEAKGAQVKIEGSAKTDVKGAMTKVEGSGVLDLKAGGIAKLKGGVTMIG